MYEKGEYVMVQDSKNSTLDMDGERYLPWMPIEWGAIHHDHLGRYYFVMQFAKGGVILDIASGEGYGAALLAQGASKVVGVDVALEAVEFAKAKYQRNNLEYKQGDGCNIPIDGYEVFDVISSFETLEHLKEFEQILLINEFDRLIKNEGLLIISTPNYEYTHNVLKYSNPHHKKELTLKEFDRLLSTKFPYRIFLGQRCYFTNQIAELGIEMGEYKETVLTTGNECYVETSVDSKIPQNYICIASKKEISEKIASTLLFDINDSYFSKLYNDQAHLSTLRSQNNEAQQQNTHINSQLTELQVSNANLQQEINDSQSQLIAQQVSNTNLQQKFDVSQAQLFAQQASNTDLQQKFNDSQAQLIAQQASNVDLQQKFNTQLNAQQASEDVLQQKFNDSQAQLVAQQISYDALQQKFNASQATLSTQETSNTYLTNSLAAIESSSSWRITRPLRILKRTLFRKKQ